MCEPISIGIASAALIGGSFIQGNQQRIATERAAGQAKAQAEDQARKAEDLIKADDQKARKPQSAAEVLYGKKDGAGSTTITGPQGVTSPLSLGKASLLGL